MPDFALPWLRFSITVISLFLVAHLLRGVTLAAAALATSHGAMRFSGGSSGFVVFGVSLGACAQRSRR